MDYGDTEKTAGITCLVNPKGQKVLLLNFQCYVSRLNENQILMWNSVVDGPKAAMVYFYIFDLLELKPISNDVEEATKLNETKEHCYFNGSVVAKYQFFTGIGEGLHELKALPEVFMQIGEVFVLSDYRCPPSDYFRNMSRAICIFNFHKRSVEIIPQDWFNKGSYDFGYQWIARVGRDKLSNQIIGVGVRMDSFLLDSSGRQIKMWCQTDFDWNEVDE